MILFYGCLGGAFEGIEDHVSPFGYKRGEGIGEFMKDSKTFKRLNIHYFYFLLDAGSGEIEWICNRERPKSDPLFETLNPIDGKISGAAAKSELIKSKLPNSVLSKIWKLSDVDCDGFLDIEEFALAMHLINIKIDGNELPNILPDHLIPPTHKN